MPGTATGGESTVPRAGRAAVVRERLNAAQRRRGKVELPGWAPPVVRIDVPLVAERVIALGQRQASIPADSFATAVFRQNLSLLYCEGTVMSPLPELMRNSWPVRAFAGISAVCRRAKARIGPGARPRRRVQRVGRRVEVGLLVGGQRPIRSVGAVLARAPASLPEDLIAAEEREVDPGREGSLHVGNLVPRPVLVVAAGDEQLMVQQQRRRSNRDRSRSRS